MKKVYVISARTEQNRTEPKKVFVMLLLMFFISTLIHAQLITHHCATDSSFFVPKALDCTPNSDAWINTYRLQESYVPKSINPWVGQKTIPVNIIFFGEDIGTGFPLTPTQFDSLRPLLQHWMNENFQSVVSPTGVVPFCNDYLNDSKIRVEIKNARFIPNSSVLNDSSNSQKNSAVYNHLNLFSEDKYQINWYIVKKHHFATGEAWTYSYNGNDHLGIITGSNYYQYGSEWISGFNRFSSHFSHELGHLLGLDHLSEVPFVKTVNINGTLINDTTWASIEYVVHDTLRYLCDVWSHIDTLYYPGGTTNNIMGGAEANGWVSPLQMGRMHMALSLDHMKYHVPNYYANYYLNIPLIVRHYAYGYNPIPIEITSDQTWDFTFKSYNDIVVKSGKTLTITCRLEMVKEASIIVEPGARLVVDGGTITSARSAGPDHEGLWQGIKLYGNSSLAQSLQPNGYYPQAHLIMKNGAVVENARNAVTNWKYNDYTKTGGLIQASNSTFRNNGRSVEFMAYDFPEKSTFIECSFIMDDTLKDGSLPSSMVTMWGVNGTRFIGNSFVCVDSIALLPSQRPKGIYTINAGFFVRPKCIQNPPPVGACPSQYSIPNSFKGLQIGIHATNADNYTFRVENARFDNCEYGLLASHVNNYTVIKSRFNVPNYYSTGLGIGLWNEFSTGFIIEENTFTGKGNKDQDLLLGLINSETGTAHNEIYKNNFDSLRLASWVSGINWAYGGGNTPLGLKYKCNSFQENNGDIFVLGGTIGQNQGSVEPLSGGGFEFYPAQNTFSTLNDPVGHFANYGQNHVYYIYYNDVPGLQYEPTKRTMNSVSVYDATNEADVQLGCPTHFPSIDAPFPAPNPTTYNHYQVLKQAYNDAAYTYYNYLDGGNTPALIQQIESAWPEEALQLRNDLLNDSPFLSMEALYGIADKTDVLPHAFMLDIFLANPHGGRDQAFIDYLLNKADPMPSYMVDVLQGDTTITLKDQMESTMSRYASEYSSIANLAIHYYRTDSINANADSVQAWLIRKGDYANALEQADQKAGATLYNVALTHLGNLGGSYLPDYLLSEQNAREDLWQMLESFQNQNQEYWSLDSAKQLQLQNFALNESYTANAMAKNILEFFYGFTFPKVIPQVNIPEPKSKKSQSQKQESKIDIRVYPNPAEQYISFDMGSQGKNGAKIEVSDMQGKTILQRNMTQKLYILDIRSLHSGTYIYRIIDNEELYTGTFIKK